MVEVGIEPHIREVVRETRDGQLTFRTFGHEPYRTIAKQLSEEDSSLSIVVTQSINEPTKMTWNRRVRTDGYE